MVRPRSAPAAGRRPALSLAVAALLLALWIPSVGALQGCRRPAVLHDLTSVEELKTQFNDDAGVPRIVLLLSPT